MLRNLKDLEQYKVSVTEGDIGSVVDFLLDDEQWTVRYLIVKMGGVPRVLITPMSFRFVDWTTQRIYLAPTTEKIGSGPNVDLDKPVSRQHERDYHEYCGYPFYWADAGLWEMSAYPSAIATNRWFEMSRESFEKLRDIHLRSASEVRGYDIQGNDDTIGCVRDFIVDNVTWSIRYLVVDTSNWRFGRKVLLAPQWASRVIFEERNVYIDMNRQSVANCPDWISTKPINHEYEARLNEHYGHPVYSNDDEIASQVRVHPPLAEWR